MPSSVRAYVFIGGVGKRPSNIPDCRTSYSGNLPELCLDAQKHPAAKVAFSILIMLIKWQFITFRAVVFEEAPLNGAGRLAAGLLSGIGAGEHAVLKPEPHCVAGAPRRAVAEPGDLAAVRRSAVRPLRAVVANVLHAGPNERPIGGRKAVEAPSEMTASPATIAMAVTHAPGRASTGRPGSSAGLSAVRTGSPGCEDAAS